MGRHKKNPINSSLDFNTEVTQPVQMGNQGANIDVPKLTGKNYLNWKSIMSDLLLLRGYQDVVSSGSTNKLKNLQAKILIKSALDDVHLGEVRNYESAKDVWDHLSRMCIGANSNDVATLVRKFYNYTYQAGDSMSTHIEKLVTMKQQLTDVDQTPTDTVFIDRILQSLPAEYDKLRENWEYMHTDMKTVEQLISRALKIEEDNKQAEVKPEAQAFFVKHDNKGQNSHIESLKKRTRCAKCGHKGHWAKECKTKRENYIPMDQRKKHTSGQSTSNQKVDKHSDEPANDLIFMVDHFMPTLPDKIEMSNQLYEFTQSHRDHGLKDYWVADSGATAHICNNESWFNKLTKYSVPKHVTVGDSGEAQIIGVGRIEVTCNAGKEQIRAAIDNVLLVPSITTNLLSVGELANKNINTLFSQRDVKFIKNNKVVASGAKLATNLYLMNIRAIKYRQNIALFCQAKRTLEEWHRSLGHASKNRINKLIDDKSLNLIATNKDAAINCADCPPGKGRHASHPSLDKRAREVGERVFVDLAGPVNVSYQGNKYFLLCKDEFSTFTYVYCLKDKASVNLALAKLIAEFEIDTGNCIRRIHTDQGTEFLNNKVELLFAVEHIKPECSAIYTPQQNGQIEREIQSVTQMARTMLLASELPKSLWDEAIKTACYLRNRLPNKNVEQTPFEIATKRKPKLSHLCEFGRQVHVVIDRSHLTKFDARTEQGYIVGFTMRSNTYRVYLPDCNRVIESCNVIFKPHKPTQQTDSGAREDATFDLNITSPQKSVLDQYFDNLLNSTRIDDTRFHDAHDTIPGGDTTTRFAETLQSPEYSRFTEQDELLTVTHPKPHKTFLVTHNAAEPISYEQAISGYDKANWLKAINEEFKAHSDNGTWIIVDKPENKKLMSTRWVFKLKTHANGSIDRYKARLVARGYEQRAGQDYHETFAPVARYDSIRTLIALATQLELKIAQFDIVTAFLNGILDEEVYLQPPKGMQVGENKALKLIKGLYGLKQAPRVWNQRFKSEIEKVGFKCLSTDNCVFKHRRHQIFICLYVDDGLILAKEADHLVQVIMHLKKVFNIRVVTQSTFVGLEIIKTNSGYAITQQAYAKRILERFEMLDSRPVTSPLLTKHKLTEFELTEPDYECPYREAIGSLLYLAANTRPDILHPVTLLAKYCNNPKLKHWIAIKRIMRYICGTTHYGIKFDKQEDLSVTVYTDADWASDSTNRKSITGTIILIAGGPVIFRSSQQSLIAQSTTEAEFIAAAESIRDLLWLESLMSELGIVYNKPKLRCDSQTAIKLIMNPEFPRRTKHIDLKYHFIRDHYSKRAFDLEYIPTQNQLADFLTKVIARDQYKTLIMKANILELST